MLFKNLKSLFIVSKDDSPSKDNPQEGTSDSPMVTPEGESVQEIIEEFSILDDFDERLEAALEGEIIDKDGIVDHKIVEQLLQEVGEKNIEGFDYFEYKQSLKVLDKMPMNEATKYRSAFATASTMGVTLQTLLESAEFYLGILDQQDEHFRNEANAKKQKQVDKKESEASRLEKQIENYKDQIKRLKEKISKNQLRIEELEREVKIDKVKLEKDRNNFVASFNFLRSQFADDIAKMKKYLK
jgi:predicted RNase H-like nuclease (RuvC/YqgF family)